MSTGVYDKYAGFHNRRSIRLRGYDYSKAGAYFITICTHDRTNRLFGDVINGKMVENEFGKIIRNEWLKTAQIRPNLYLDEFVVMPNHVHGIIVIGDRRGTLQRAPTTTKNHEQFGKPTSNSIPTIVRLIKSATTKRINEIRDMPGVPVWQRNYYERIVRDQKSLYCIRKYIRDNPPNWSNDNENQVENKCCEFDRVIVPGAG